MKAKSLIWSFVLSFLLPFNGAAILSACTIFNATEGRRTIAAGNEDYQWTNARIRYTEPTADYYGTMLFFNGNYPQIGMNDQGLFYDWNAIPDTGWSADPGKQSYSGNLETQILRECATVDEVIAMYAQYNENTFSIAQIHWADATGASIVATYDTDLEKDGYLAKSGHFQVSTNFNVLTSTGPCWRYDKATDLLANNRNVSIALMSHVCSQVQQNNTIFSYIFDTATGDVYVHCHYPSKDFNNVAILNIDEELAKGNRDVFLTSLLYSPKYNVFPPAITALIPENNAPEVPIDGKLSLTFTETVYAGSGSITIRQYSDDTVFETIDVKDVDGLGTTTITIDPVQEFSINTRYYMLIDSTCLRDQQGDFYHGIPVKTSWSFTTTGRGPDSDPPAISSVVTYSDPRKIQVVFDEPVLKHTAETPTNYEMDNGVMVTAAVLGTHNRTVTLTTTMLSEGTYTLTAKNIEDYWGNIVPSHMQKTFSYTDASVLRAHWELDESEGLTAHDSTGTYDANLVGGPLWKPEGGMIGGALQFDGIDDYAETPPVELYSEGASFSVFAWVKDGGLNQVIISRVGNTILLQADHINGNLMTAFMYPESYSFLISDTSIIDGQWHHIGLVWDAESLTRMLLIDCVVVAQDTMTRLPYVSTGIWKIRFGMWDSGSTGAWSGLIDDVRICDLNWDFVAAPAHTTDPYPDHEASLIPLDVKPSWSPGLTAATHDVYFGTSSPPPLIGNQETTSYDPGPLEPGVTYYWQVDEVEADGVTRHVGNVWNLTTVPGHAMQRDPANGAFVPAVDIMLTWLPGPTAATHNVYFGTSSPPPFEGNQEAAMFNPGLLEPGTTYYWQVDEIEADSTTTYTGDVWSFTTSGLETGAITYEVWEDIGVGHAVSNLTDYQDYPHSPSYSHEITSFEAPTDIGEAFGSRIHGYLHPETSGDYRFWIASDGRGELWLSTDESYRNAVLISKTTCSAKPRDFDDPDVIASDSIPLEGGRKYYIMALYREARGNDNCAVGWEGPDSPVRSVISGYYLSPFVALWASVLEPADGAVEVLQTTTLRWSPGVTAASHDVHLGTDQQAVIDGHAFVGNQTETSYNPEALTKGATYYWRIDEVEADGTEHIGDVWQFTVKASGR